ncbi:MAG: RHS repeat-associated core domain-containing protein [Oscillospiraceae bacterium]|nr:RHS repeat-associated core domain-containing protein [Oscillospiraceae bacterium]
MVNYEYDSWGVTTAIKDENGNIITDTNNIGYLNLMRYRSYHLDQETGLYYLQSRYYNPDWGRYLNSDSLVDTGGSIIGTNMYAYCYNNPVNISDASGYIPVPIPMALSIMMYLQAKAGGGHYDFSAWYDAIGAIMRDRLYNSKTLKSRIDSYISKMGNSNSYTKSEGIVFQDTDLAYSVGKADCKLSVTNNGKQWFTGKTKYSVTVILTDTYDFHKLGKNDAGFIKRTINNFFGYWPQSFNWIQPYSWKITYTFTYYK